MTFFVTVLCEDVPCCLLLKKENKTLCKVTIEEKKTIWAVDTDEKELCFEMKNRSFVRAKHVVCACEYVVLNYNEVYENTFYLMDAFYGFPISGTMFFQ